jgi:hypothetical protein
MITEQIPIIKNDDDIIEMVRAVSYQNGERLRKMSYRKQRSFVRKAIKSHEVVWLAWEDGDEFHCYCIKGRGCLGVLKSTAFHVASRTDAIAVATEWGDGWPDLHEMPGTIQ